MTAQLRYQAWLFKASTLDISKESDLMDLFSLVTELNKITQEAEREINK